MEQIYPNPYLIDFPSNGESAIGYISVAEYEHNLPFRMERVFWTYYTPESIMRGRHAHYRTEQILIAVAGQIVVTTECVHEAIQTFVLDRPNKGLYIPPCTWHTMQYSHTAVQMVLASTRYDERDYIRDYTVFQQHWQKKG